MGKESTSLRGQTVGQRTWICEYQSKVVQHSINHDAHIFLFHRDRLMVQMHFTRNITISACTFSILGLVSVTVASCTSVWGAAHPMPRCHTFNSAAHPAAAVRGRCAVRGIVARWTCHCIWFDFPERALVDIVLQGSAFSRTCLWDIYESNTQHVPVWSMCYTECIFYRTFQKWISVMLQSSKTVITELCLCRIL